jgi:hypothetical protein
LASVHRSSKCTSRDVMRAALRPSSVLHVSPIAGGENAGNRSEILGWNAQDGSPRCGLAPQRKSALRSFRCRVAAGVCETHSAVNIRGEFEKCKPRGTVVLTKHGHSPALGRSQARGERRGSPRRRTVLSGIRHGERDCPEVYGSVGDNRLGGGERATVVGVNYWGVNFRREINWLPTLDTFRTFLTQTDPACLQILSSLPPAASLAGGANA